VISVHSPFPVITLFSRANFTDAALLSLCDSLPAAPSRDVQRSAAIAVTREDEYLLSFSLSLSLSLSLLFSSRQSEKAR